MILRILAVGDVVGAPGLTFLTERLRAFREQEHIDFTVVNGENANVVGVTPKQADAIFAAGADVITLGNHTWTRYELQPYLEQKKRILRPANFAPQCPGRGWGEYSVRGGPICVINLMGRFTLDTNTDNPFLVVDDILEQTQAKIVLVDMHAEATSEKRAMGFYLDGRVTAVWGTHTHVQTSDAEVLPEGTYLCMSRWGMPYEPEGIRAIVACMDRHALQPIGNAFDFCYLDTTSYDESHQEDFCCIQIPVALK